MVDELVATAAFKRTFQRSGPHTGWQTGWLQFDFPDTSPDNFREWCESLPGVMTVGGSFDYQHPNRYVLYFQDFNDATALLGAIDVIISAASKQFGYTFEVDNQGVHTPPPRIRDDRNFTDDLWSLGAPAIVPVSGNRMPYGIPRWRQRESSPPPRTPRRTWLRQSVRWVGRRLLSQTLNIFVIPLLKITAMVDMIRKARRRR